MLTDDERKTLTEAAKLLALDGMLDAAAGRASGRRHRLPPHSPAEVCRSITVSSTSVTHSTASAVSRAASRGASSQAVSLATRSRASTSEATVMVWSAMPSRMWANRCSIFPSTTDL